MLLKKEQLINYLLFIGCWCSFGPLFSSQHMQDANLDFTSSYKRHTRPKTNTPTEWSEARIRQRTDQNRDNKPSIEDYTTEKTGRGDFVDATREKFNQEYPKEPPKAY